MTDPILARATVSGVERPRPQAHALIFTKIDYDYEVTHHPVLVDEHGGASLDAGRALLLGDVREWLAALDGQAKRTGMPWLPDGLLAEGPDGLVWYTRPVVRPMFFSLGGKRLTLKAVPWPGLVFMARGGSLWVAALRSNRRPARGTRLYHCPLMNVYENGSVCLGSATRPARDMGTADTMRVWEAAIYDTNFTHVNQTGTLKRGAKGKGKVNDAAHVRFWKSLEGATRFPHEHLNPMGCTLKEFCHAG